MPASGYYPPPRPTQAPPSTSPPTNPPAAASIPRPTAAPAPVPSPAAPPPAPPRPPTGDASLANIIDTIEAIIIALIIALTFRAFIVEAFVIPTGSMAPTLLGAHIHVICPECGYEFDKDATLEYQAHILIDKDGSRHLVINGVADTRAELLSNSLVPCDELPIFCPNCRYPIKAEQLPQYLGTFDVVDGRHGGAIRKIPFVWVNNGDRILVMKYLYSVLPPERWDVIVFKEPQNAKDNYIKRLIGRPGETIEIINGDIYIQPAAADDAAPAAPSRPEDRKIARKPQFLQQYLWQLVYDNDHYPMDEGAARPLIASEREMGAARNLPVQAPTWNNPWQPTTPDWATGVIMAYTGAGRSSLKFNVAPKDAPPYTVNTLGYNDDLYPYFDLGREWATRSIVGDLRLETVWTPTQADSNDITLTLGRPNNCYQVTWTAKGLSLLHYNETTSKFEPLPSGAAQIDAVAPPRKDASYHLALNNVDHAVHFFLDGKEVITYEPQWTARDAMDDIQLHPTTLDQANSLISIDVSGPAILGHLKVFRDLHYTQVNPIGSRGAGTATVGNPLTLGKDEFFAMGDNSRRSSDGRLWGSVYPALDDLGLRAGIVPRRYLLGKAFFVYWPAGFRPTTDKRIPLFSTLPIVPDVGDMRLIR